MSGHLTRTGICVIFVTNPEDIAIDSNNVVEQELSYLPEPLQDRVRTRWQAFAAANPQAAELPFEVANSLPLVWTASDFVAGLCERQPHLLFDLAGHDLLHRYDWEEYNDRLIALLMAVDDEAGLLRVLREFRQREMLRIVWRDIAGWAELMETTRELSHLAEACIDQALHKLYVWHCQQFGTPFHADGGPMNMVVLGMGKLGAWELNLSSDIDLIFAFAEEGQTLDGPRSLSHGEFFTRLGKKLIAALDQQTAEGFVFRVDMRLRPFGDSGPLVSSFSAMENYYQLHGREWERYAMVKARVVGGDRQDGEHLMGILRPFVYRRYIDYGVFESLREMKALIAREVKRKSMEDNVKLGAGGIREIEFIGQAFQLIRGGRDSKLTARKILKVLAYLAEADYLPPYVVEELTSAYIFLRTVEHRLQEVADQQTHVLPRDEIGRLRLAFSLGYENWQGFCRDLDAHRQRVQAHFEQVFEAPQGEQAGGEGEQDLNAVWLDTLDEEDSLAVLAQSGFQRPAEILKHLARLRKSRAYHGLSKLGRSRLDRLVPLILAAAGQAESPDDTALRLLDLLAHIAPRSVYLALLVENPLALSQLVKLVSASAWIASYLQKFPLLLDELLDPRILYAPPDKAGLQKELQQRLAPLGPEDQEQSMDALRHFKHTNVLRVAAADISGVLPLMKVSDHLTWIAECVLDGALELAWQHLLERHGRPPCEVDLAACDKGFAIIGYGKLGGIELGYGSDLDLVFLHGGASGKTSDGKVPVETPVFYARLGQRLIHVLTAFTPAGSSYEIDMRLRPDGASGMLVSSLKAYAAYQQDKAWLWEHQALVRARPVAGDPLIGARFEAIRRQILGQRRDHDELVRGIVEMRQRMRENLDTGNPALFHLKQGPGGLVDIEFIVQYGVLAQAHAHPELLDFTDNVRLLDRLGHSGLLGEDEARTLADAYRDYRGTAHRRALAEQSGPVDGKLFVEQRQAVQAVWRRLFETAED